MNLKDLSTTVDIELVEQEARMRWEEERKRRRTIEQRTVTAMPAGLLVMAIVFFIISAAHTASVVSLTTGLAIAGINIGLIAPIGFELGIFLIAAFRAAGHRNFLTSSLLVVLIVITVLINVGGGIMAVVATYKVEQGVLETTAGAVVNMPIQELVSAIGTLPASFQIALLIAPVLGAAIPFLTWATGEIIIGLALGKIKLTVKDDEDVWQREAPQIVHKALISAALKVGAGVTIAGRWADAVIHSRYSRLAPAVGRTIPVVEDDRGMMIRPAMSVESEQFVAFALPRKRENEAFTPVHSAFSERNSVNEQRTGYTKNMNAREVVQQYFDVVGDNKDLTIDQLREAIQQWSGVQIGRTTVHNVRAGK